MHLLLSFRLSPYCREKQLSTQQNFRDTLWGQMHCSQEHRAIQRQGLCSQHKSIKFFFHNWAAHLKDKTKRTVHPIITLKVFKCNSSSWRLRGTNAHWQLFYNNTSTYSLEFVLLVYPLGSMIDLRNLIKTVEIPWVNICAIWWWSLQKLKRILWGAWMCDVNCKAIWE